MWNGTAEPLTGEFNEMTVLKTRCDDINLSY